MPFTEISLNSLVFVAAVLAVGTGLVLKAKLKNRKFPLPPGPFGLPFVGSIQALPSIINRTMPKVFLDLARDYGDVAYFSAFGHNLLVVSGMEAARDLLEKKADLYIDRPHNVWFVDLLGWGNSLPHLRYGNRFRKQRRMLKNVTNEKAVDSYSDVREKATKLLVRKLVESPGDLKLHLESYTALNILNLTYGKTEETMGPLIELARDATVCLGSEGSSLVDFIPTLKYTPTWFPLAQFMRESMQTKSTVLKFLDDPYQEVAKKMGTAEGAPDCFVSKNIQAMGGLEKMSDEDVRDVRGAAGIMYSAAQDTTACVLHSFILAMTRNPQVFYQAQKELDQVLGGRLPTVSDVAHLPYLAAVIKETYRWSAPVPINMPHLAMQDNSYRDYVIPKDTKVLVNIYAIMCSCPAPEEFLPERFIDGKDLGSVPADPREAVFGFGGRRCPGYRLADAAIQMAVLHLISLFDITREVDAKGREIIPEAKFGNMTVRHPLPFQCRVTPRKSRKHLVEQLVAN